VLVLDDAPPELVRLVGYLESIAGYLESIAPDLVIDLVAVAAYELNAAKMLVPLRLDAERPPPPAAAPPTPAKHGYLRYARRIQGAHQQRASSITSASRADVHVGAVTRTRGLVRLLACRGKSATTLLPYLPNDDAGLITVCNDNGFSVSFWRSVFECHAPNSIARIEPLIAPTKVGQGTVVKNISDELIAALTEAYEEAYA
jgi:hypothetical protein